MKAKHVVSALLMCGIVASAAPVLADESVALSDTPPAVQKVIHDQVADGKMGGITKSTEDYDTVYDVDLTAKDGSERDFTVAQDGTLVSVEVPLADTPAEVQQTIKSELNGGDLDSIDKNLDDTVVSYDVAGTGKGGKEMDFTVDDDGTLSSRQVALTDTPDAVQKTIAAQLNGGKVKTIDENLDEDSTNFDVSIAKPDGSETSFRAAADGTLMSKEVSLDEVPARARPTIDNRIGDGTVLRVDKSYEKQGNVMPYEVEGRKDGKPFDFSVAPRGRFLRMQD